MLMGWFGIFDYAEIDIRYAETHTGYLFFVNIVGDLSGNRVENGVKLNVSIGI